MRGSRSLVGASAVLGLLVVLLAAAPASAATTSFGAKLTHNSQPQDSKSSCHSQAPGKVPNGGVCTWVGLDSFENGSHAQAPKTGTLHHLHLVACNAGSFQLQLVRLNSSQHAALHHSGPTIHYAADPRTSGGNCGGVDQNDYIVQGFNINVPVTKGDYIAVKTSALDMLHCSGDDVQLYYPALSSSTFRSKKGDAGCDLLINVSY